MDIYVDATTLIALGRVGALDLLTVFDSDVLVPVRVAREVTSEPAKTNLQKKIESEECRFYFCGNASFHIEEACDVLDVDRSVGDAWIISWVLHHEESGDPVAVVSDDRRVRTVARGLGATVTGTIGVVVRNVVDGEITADEAKELVRRLDSHGLHMTGELREKADELIDEAAEDCEE